MHIPDPVAQELAQLKERIAALEAALAAEKEGAASEKKTERGGLSDFWGPKLKGRTAAFLRVTTEVFFAQETWAQIRTGTFAKNTAWMKTAELSEK